MDIIAQLEKEQAAVVAAKRAVPEFGPGDTVIVNVKVKEGERSRVQEYGAPGDTLRMVASPISVAGEALPMQRSPALGADTDKSDRDPHLAFDQLDERTRRWGQIGHRTSAADRGPPPPPAIPCER